MGWTEADIRAVVGPQRCRVLMGLNPTPALPADTPEDAFLHKVRQLARREGWLCYHTHRSERSEPGFPDLVLTKPGRLIFAELKSATGKLTPFQHTWLDLLRHSVAHVEVYCWRPADYAEIVAILTRRTP